MQQGQTAMSIAQKLGYISVVETLKGVTEVTTITPLASDEKYKVVSPETMQETFMSDSEDEGGKAARLQSGSTQRKYHFEIKPSAARYHTLPELHTSFSQLTLFLTPF